MQSTDHYKTLKCERSRAALKITLHRPESANALDHRMTRELADVAALCASADVRVVVLTGAGRFFSVGGDLGAFASALHRGSYIKEIADALHRAISTFSHMDAVLITVVNGVAAGAGLSIAASGDIVLAAESASFTMAYTRVGLSPDGSASYYLPRLIGLRRTQELMLTNRTLSADEAAQWGLATEVVADEQLQVRADQLVEQFASGARRSNAAVKKLLRETFRNGLEEQLELEGRLIAELADSPDGREGVDAFLAKRRARFD